MTDSCDFNTEFHFPGLNYCGPGTDLTKRLEADGKTPKQEYMPVDRIDEVALRHDIFYAEHHSARERVTGDDIMLAELYEIPNLTCREKFERAVIAPLLWLKRNIIATWLLLIEHCCSIRRAAGS